MTAILRSPLRVFFFCCVFALCSLAYNKALLNLYGQRRDRDLLTEQIEGLHQSLVRLDQSLQKAKDPLFIERQALDQLDMVTDRDLVFIFAD